MGSNAVADRFKVVYEMQRQRLHPKLSFEL